MAGPDEVHVIASGRISVVSVSTGFYTSVIWSQGCDEQPP
jgi:hypothetical protein